MIIEHLLYTGYWYRMTLALTSQKTLRPTGRLQLVSLYRDLPVRALSFQLFHREDQFCLFRLILLPGLRVPARPLFFSTSLHHLALLFLFGGCSFEGSCAQASLIFTWRNHETVSHLPSSLLDILLKEIVCILTVIHLSTHR